MYLQYSSLRELISIDADHSASAIGARCLSSSLADALAAVNAFSACVRFIDMKPMPLQSQVFFSFRLSSVGPSAGVFWK